ncbi:MAG: hypothetical protein EAX89_12865 [Candidatus Lokiarchaeota archaeon]|nr:hypothetical protein [Candidatus Lokiarchaeota archaeon]
MGYIESLIISFSIGWVNSYLYRKYLRRRNKDWIVFLAFFYLVSIWGIEILIYNDFFNIKFLNGLPWIDLPSSEPGKYYLWNSFILFGLDYNIIPQPGMESISVFLSISYLFWYYFGSKIGKVLHGYKTYQGGLYLIIRPVKKYIKDREKRFKEFSKNIKP